MGEECDDGNLEANDGCSPTCKVEVHDGWSCTSDGATSRCFRCGDGIRQGVEECDDKARESHDGCSDQCQVEPGYVCASANEFAPSVCQPQTEYKTTILATLKDNEQKCNKQDMPKTFVASDPVTGGGECVLPPAAQFETTKQQVQTQTSLSGAPLTLSPVAITQMSVRLNSLLDSGLSTPSIGNLSEGKIHAVCRASQTVVCGTGARAEGGSLPSTFCVDHTATQCQEVCVDASTGCDREAGGKIVERPYGNYLTSAGLNLCCYQDCKVPESWGMTDISIQKWCGSHIDPSVTIQKEEQDPPEQPDDQAVVSLDNDAVQPADEDPPAETKHFANHTEMVGPFDFKVFTEDGAMLHSTHAEASCLINRAESCQTLANGKMDCISTSKASCASVFGPKFLCSGSSEGELRELKGTTVCEFKDCKTPTNWVTANDAPITPKSWCFVKNIAFGAALDVASSQDHQVVLKDPLASTSAPSLHVGDHVVENVVQDGAEVLSL